jgi:hypothetical protein
VPEAGRRSARAAGEGFAAVGEDAERLQLAIDLQHPQGLGADSDDRDGVGAAGVGLAVVAGVEEPDPGCHLGRDVDDVLAGLEESLGQRTERRDRGSAAAGR